MTWTWGITFLSIAGTILNVKRDRGGFLLWIVANTLWMGVDIQAGIYSQAALQVIFTGFAIWGWIEWGKEKIGE